MSSNLVPNRLAGIDGADTRPVSLGTGQRSSYSRSGFSRGAKILFLANSFHPFGLQRRAKVRPVGSLVPQFRAQLDGFRPGGRMLRFARSGLGRGRNGGRFRSKTDVAGLEFSNSLVRVFLSGPREEPFS